jgi:hypothetical protein
MIAFVLNFATNTRTRARVVVAVFNKDSWKVATAREGVDLKNNRNCPGLVIAV